MSTDKTRAEWLADALENLEATGWGGDCFALTEHSEKQATLAAAELRRIPALEAERDELRAEAQALREDAERYRWLRDTPCSFDVFAEACSESMDEDVDAARE